jgi:KDO2-lipid IV(A) lauroyltransferase
MIEPAPGVAGRTGRGLGWIAHSALRLRRPLVESQISESFSDRDQEWVRRVAAGCYRHFGEEFTLLASGRRAVQQAISRVTPSDVLDRLHDITGGAGACVVVTGHIGNWELAGAYLAELGVPVTAVARRQRGGFGRRLRAAREALGIEIIDHDQGAAPVVRALRSGRCVTLVADQHAYNGSEPISFLGRPAWTRLGPARLAAAAGVPLVFGAMVRDGAGYRAVWNPIDQALVESGDPVTPTRSWLSLLEEAVKQRPEQYFWFHRRWKG